MSEPSVWLKLGEKQSMQMLSARMYLEQAAEVLVSRAGCAPDWGWGRTGGGGGGHLFSTCRDLANMQGNTKDIKAIHKLPCRNAHGVATFCWGHGPKTARI